MDLFSWFMVVGVVGILLSLIIDSAIDMLDDNGLIFGLFVSTATFGALGSIFQGLSMPFGVNAAISAIFGIFLGAYVRWVYRKLKASNESPMNDFADRSKIIGRNAEVIWWKDGKGEVEIVFSGELLRFPAESSESLTKGETPVVVSMSNGLVSVERRS